MAYFLVLNGPNLNLLGQREPGIYGTQTLAQINEALKIQAESAGHRIAFLQSNAEHEMVEAVQRAPAEGVDAILINPAAFPHTSVALLKKFKALHPLFFKHGNLWSLDEHRKKIMDWLPQHLAAARRAVGK